MFRNQVPEANQLKSASIVDESSLQPVYKAVKTFISSSTLVYGSRSTILEIEKTLKKYETLLNSCSATNEDEENILSLIQTKKTRSKLSKRVLEKFKKSIKNCLMPLKEPCKKDLFLRPKNVKPMKISKIFPKNMT